MIRYVAPVTRPWKRKRMRAKETWWPASISSASKADSLANRATPVPAFGTTASAIHQKPSPSAV